MSGSLDATSVNLSPEQLYAFEVFKTGKNIFITGPGGTGKTKLIGHFVNYAKENAIQIDVCAMTGCAALLLNCNAKTLHSWSGIRLGKGSRDKIISIIMKNKYAIAQWRKAKILIIDEVSMLSQKLFELCDDIGRTVRKINRPFGGIQVIFSGDFYQLPPVGTYGEPDTEQFCFESERWRSIFKPENHIQLKTMFRQTDPLYIDILLQIRKGELSPENAEILKSRVKKEYNPEENGGCVLTKLFPVRARADCVNRIMYEKITEEEHLYNCNRMSSCTTYIENNTPIPYSTLTKCNMLTEKEKETHLDYLLTNSPISEQFQIKKGSSVMCLINLDMDSGICNGSQGIVIDFKVPVSSLTGELCPVVRFTNGVTKIITRHTWQSEEYPSLGISQFPLCLAWALTIHKIQGATMSIAEMDLGNAIFEYGQTYVALSRIQTLDGLYLSAFHPQRIKANPKVKAFYDAIETPIELKPVDEIKLDLKQFAYLPEEASLKSLELQPPVLPPTKTRSTNIKVIRL